MPHYLDYTSVEKYTYDMVLDGCTIVVERLKVLGRGQEGKTRGIEKQGVSRR